MRLRIINAKSSTCQLYGFLTTTLSSSEESYGIKRAAGAIGVGATANCLSSTVTPPQIGILVPIEPQRRTNGTSGTGSSMKHLKAVPFKTKKAPKRGNFHSPM